MAIMPLAIFEIIMGMVNGDTRLGPFSNKVTCSRSKVAKPPIPLPTITPKRRLSIAATSTPASAIAILAAATANCT